MRGDAAPRLNRAALPWRPPSLPAATVIVLKEFILNIYSIASAAVSAVVPRVNLSVQVSTGYTTNADGSRTPLYAAPQVVSGSMQALQYNDITQLDALSIQGERRKIYINGQLDGLVRVETE